MRSRSLLVAALLTAAVPSSASAQLGGCWLRYDGVDDQVRVVDSGAFPVFEYTISAWVKTTGSTTVQAILTRGEDETADVMKWGFGLLSDGRVYVQIEDTIFNSIAYPGTTAVNDGSWHHVAATRALNGDVEIFVDGLPDASHTNTLVTTATGTQTMGMGFSFQDAGQPGGAKPPLLFLDGSLDEVTLWTLPLSSADVAALKENGLPTSTVGLQAHWKLDEGSGQTASDSGSGHDGTLGSLTGADTADPAWVCGRPVRALPPFALAALALALLLAGSWRVASARGGA